MDNTDIKFIKICALLCGIILIIVLSIWYYRKRREIIDR